MKLKKKPISSEEVLVERKKDQNEFIKITTYAKFSKKASKEIWKWYNTTNEESNFKQLKPDLT